MHGSCGIIQGNVGWVYGITSCEAGACATPCTPPHGPFNRAQDKNVQGTRSSKSGIEVTKSGFSSNVHSLRSLSSPLHRIYYLSDHGVTPTERPHHPKSLSTSLYPTYECDTTCYGPREWYGPTNSGHPGLGFLFPHPGSHQHSNTSLVRYSFHSSKPLETHSDASGHIFQPITDHL
jgi:hypothetical protein